MPRFIESEEFEEKINQWAELGLQIYYLPTYCPGLNRMYADEKNWQTDWKKPFSDEVQNFIIEAMKLSVKKQF
jgi:hypothetical protein